MKIKTSITLSKHVLEMIDRRSRDFNSRSEFIEEAAKSFLASLERSEADRRDLEIIDRNADRLNAEAGDVLDYQLPL
jgi:metal-responsive CopG/Arc/MetJ family transcriptional regulator